MGSTTTLDRVYNLYGKNIDNEKVDVQKNTL